jgi:hypothetical protein
MTAVHSFETLRAALRPERAALIDHTLYAQLSGLREVRTFMEHHVFAVWDFMSLLKGLQRALTCVDVPWVPRGDSTARRLINEIVVGEESDDAPGGGYISHFELYLAAMRQTGARTETVERFVEHLRDGSSVSKSLVQARAPRGSAQFVESTFATLSSGSLPRIAAAFTLGREEIIPDMFLRVVRDLATQDGQPLTLLVDYLERHIHLDGERHGPMAARMLESICGADPAAWQAALESARTSLVARRALWDSIHSALPTPQPA